MNKIFVAFGALSIVAASPSLSQTAAPAGAALPECGGSVQDSCDQSQTTERYALTAAQAEKTGGVGDRHAGRMGGMAMGGSMSKHHAMKHGSMKHHSMKRHSMKAKTTTETATPPAM